MMHVKLEMALNEQVQVEFQSAYLYLAMSAYCDSKGLKGFSHWLRIQYDEEMMHGFKIMGYIQERGGRAILQALSMPEKDYGTTQQVFEQVLAHEQKVTQKITALYELAKEEKDYATAIFLEWFVTEQVEEEANANAILDKFKLMQDCGSGMIFHLDKEMGSRQE